MEDLLGLWELAEAFYETMGARRLGEVQSRIKPDLFLPHMEYKIES